MKTVTLYINNHPYELACADDQTARLHELARDLDHRSKNLKASLGTVKPQLLMVMLALTMLDELQERGKLSPDAAARDSMAEWKAKVEALEQEIRQLKTDHERELRAIELRLRALVESSELAET